MVSIRKSSPGVASEGGGVARLSIVHSSENEAEGGLSSERSAIISTPLVEAGLPGGGAAGAPSVGIGGAKAIGRGNETGE